MTQRRALSPHHFGEVLVARLLALADLAAIPVRAPHQPTTVLSLGTVLGVDEPPVEILPNARLEASPGSPRFDGMHDIDCALVFEREVVPIELKLGETGLSPALFGRRFVEKGTRLTHGDSAIAGSMVALLERNGREVDGQRSFVLRACARPVRRQWLLMLREETWLLWARTPGLLAKLGTQQLAGVITLEDLAEQVGVSRARELALAAAKESIGPWFSRSTTGGSELTREERDGSPSSAALSLLVVRCRDLDRSCAFYGSLGLSLHREQHGEGPVHYSATLHDGAVLELYPSPPERPFAPMRFGLRVTRFGEIAAALGAEVSVERETRARRCVVKDPDGHVIHLSSS